MNGNVWVKMIDEAECGYLTLEHLQQLGDYAGSFAARLTLYQEMKRQEMGWIGSILRQLGYSSDGDLDPVALMLAQLLATHLRDMSLEMLAGDPTVEVPVGLLETALPLTAAWRYLHQLMQRDLDPEFLRLIMPHWEKRSDQFRPQDGIPEEVETQPTKKDPLTPEIEAELITLMEMFS